MGIDNAARLWSAGHPAAKIRSSAGYAPACSGGVIARINVLLIERRADKGLEENNE